ncbi:MAG: C25 family peptidase propeptide domain-containing protein, partial [Candidatus Cloacimonadota bacterium]|nr:C25 family peptidase propeptide domain-containing protein [Candidatus Cloacimonadota bacterium]
MKKILLILTLSLLIFSCLWSENSFTITQMTENNIQLKLHIDEYSFSDINIKGKLYQNIELSGIDFLRLSEEGAPKLPFFSKVIGLPPDGNISAKIISENHKIIENKNISYNPTYFEKNGKLIANFDIPASYQNRTFLPGKLIESE